MPGVETVCWPKPPAASSDTNPLSWARYVRSYYFTRQNASNNPGTQFNFTPGAKYNSNGVNQASCEHWDRVRHAEWDFPDSGLDRRGTYFYSNAIDGTVRRSGQQRQRRRLAYRRLHPTPIKTKRWPPITLSHVRRGRI